MGTYYIIPISECFIPSEALLQAPNDPPTL